MSSVFIDPHSEETLLKFTFQIAKCVQLKLVTSETPTLVDYLVKSSSCDSDHLLEVSSSSLQDRQM